MGKGFVGTSVYSEKEITGMTEFERFASLDRGIGTTTLGRYGAAVR